MADISYRNMPHDGDLAAALNALPLATPAQSAWPQLAAAFAQRARRKRQARFAIALATAAVLALAVGLGRLELTPGTTPAVANVATTVAPNADLIARNDEMQAMLRGFDTRSVPLDGQAALASARLEDLIAMLDLELGEAAPDEAHALWSQRLVLLQELATVRQQGQAAVAQQGDEAELSPASWVID